MHNIKSWKNKIKFPLHYDNYPQWIMDADNLLFLDVRGFGNFKDEKLQDEFGQWVTNTLNKEYTKKNKAKSEIYPEIYQEETKSYKTKYVCGECGFYISLMWNACPMCKTEILKDNN